VPVAVTERETGGEVGVTELAEAVTAEMAGAVHCPTVTVTVFASACPHWLDARAQNVVVVVSGGVGKFEPVPTGFEVSGRAPRNQVMVIGDEP